MKFARAAGAGLAVLVLAGCAVIRVHPNALNSVDRFVALPDEPRVRYEPGAEAFARHVARALPEAITRVEAGHFREFLNSPKVYVCGTDQCYSDFVTRPATSAAVVPDNRLVLSPRLDGAERERLPGLLAHELSHLHLGQRIGHVTQTVPLWFHEGLATLVADGAGAEYAGREQALAEIRGGRRIDAAVRDTWEMRHGPREFGLPTHVFYREAQLIVEAMARSGACFHEFLLALQDDQDFDTAFMSACGEPIPARVERFYALTMPPPSSPAGLTPK